MHRSLKPRRVAPLSVLLLVGLFVAGCGGSSSTTTETTATISKAEFVAKGNAICVAGEKAQQAKTSAFLKAQGLKEGEEPSQAQLIEVVETVLIPNIQSQIDQIKALGAPSGEEQQVNSALKTSQDALNELKEDPELALSNENSFRVAGEELQALGLTKCATT